MFCHVSHINKESDIILYDSNREISDEVDTKK